jgi:hypothetical protein
MKKQLILSGLMLSLVATAGEINTLKNDGSTITYWTDTNGKMVVVDTNSKTNIYELNYGQRFLLEMKKLGWVNSASVNSTSAKPVFTPNVIGYVNNEYQAQRINQVIEYNKKMKAERQLAAEMAAMQDFNDRIDKRMWNTPIKTGRSYYYPESRSLYETYHLRGMEISTMNGEPWRITNQ